VEAGVPIAREDMLAFVSGKEPITVRRRSTVNCHDCLWYGDKALDSLGYLERLHNLRRVLPQDRRFLKFAPYRVAAPHRNRAQGGLRLGLEIPGLWRVQCSR